MGRLIGCVDIMKKKGREKIIAEVWGVVPETKTLVYEVTRISYCHREVAYSLVYFEAPRRGPFGACTWCVFRPALPTGCARTHVTCTTKRYYNMYCPGT